MAGRKVTHPAVAEGVGATYVPVEEALGVHGATNEKQKAEA